MGEIDTMEKRSEVIMYEKPQLFCMLKVRFFISNGAVGLMWIVIAFFSS